MIVHILLAIYFMIGLMIATAYLAWGPGAGGGENRAGDYIRAFLGLVAWLPIGVGFVLYCLALVFLPVRLTNRWN